MEGAFLGQNVFSAERSLAANLPNMYFWGGEQTKKNMFFSINNSLLPFYGAPD